MHQERPVHYPDRLRLHGEPFISEAQLTLHRTKHHQAQVSGANAIFARFDAARKEKTYFDVKRP